MEKDLERLESVYRPRTKAGEFWDHRSFHPLVEDVFLLERQFQELVLETVRRKQWNPQDLFVCELGCGWGRNLSLFTELGIPCNQIVGVEFLEHFIATAKKLQPALDIRRRDARETGLPGASQDLVLVHTVLSAVLEPRLQADLIQEALRLLKPGGLLVILDLLPGYAMKFAEDAQGKTVPFLKPVAIAPLFQALGGQGRIFYQSSLGLRPRLRGLFFRRLHRLLRAPKARRLMAELASCLPFASTHRFFAWEKR